ncbi:MAG TPA: hypothetical protein DD979_01275 [Gammaproteobacteria bacterium]|jgi:hypothetical protein|nr:hypothetical protein [Gammaproteobacteria bacterium]
MIEPGGDGATGASRRAFRISPRLGALGQNATLNTAFYHLISPIFTLFLAHFCRNMSIFGWHESLIV